MIKVSATKLRNELFDYLDKAEEGATIIAHRNNHDVAHLVPVKQMNWRDKMKIRPKLLMSPEEFIKPLENL